MRKKGAGFVGLIVIVSLLLAGCGAASSVSSAVSSIASSITATSSSAASTPPADTSAPATSEPPSTTSAATSPAASSPAESAQPTQTATVIAPAAQSPAPSTTATATSGSGFPWLWFWIAVAIAVVIGLVAWIIAAHRRRARAATDWQARVIDAYAKGAALHDAMAAAETPGALAAENAAFRWSDIQRRADDYTQLLYGMQQTAAGDQERLRIANVLASLQAARSAMDAERSGGTFDGMVAGLVRERLASFAAALTSLRQPDARPAGSTGPGPA